MRAASRKRRWAAFGVASALVLVGCTPAAAPSSTPSASVPGGVTTPAGTAAPQVTVPPPTQGTITSVAPQGTAAASTRPPVAITQPATAGVLTARIASIKALNVPARGVGEVAGPGVSVTLSVTNRSGREVNVDALRVNLYDSDQNPGSSMDSSTKPLRGSLRAGQSGQGVYVFTVAAGKRRPITVEVLLPTGEPALRFAGNVP